jgi:ABC-type dipeptide/oligopeptide/nickel transport system permease component
MLYYIAKRILQIIPVIIGITILLFVLLYVIPEDPAQLMLEKGATPQALQNLREKMGTDKPVYVQYWRYVKQLSKGDLGDSYRYRRPVNTILAEHYPNSIKLAVAAIIIETIIGLIAGIISAARKYSFLDALVTISTAILVCIPVYWLGMVLQIGIGLKLGWLPMSGMGDGSLKYYILPAITLASASTAFVARITRSSMLEVMGNEYIRTAYAKGLSNNAVIYKHALKNALIPIITYIGIDLGTLMGGAILTETIFAWPGVGRTIYLAILQRDAPVVIGGTIVLVLIFVFINLIVDIIYAFLDPRIRLEGGGAINV